MKKSDLVSVSALVKDALAFYKDIPLLEMHSSERYVLYRLLDVNDYLVSYISTFDFPDD